MRNPRYPTTHGTTLVASAALHLAVLALIALHGSALSPSAEGFAMPQGVAVTLVQGPGSAASALASTAPSASPSLASMTRRFDATSDVASETRAVANTNTGASPSLDALFNVTKEGPSAPAQNGAARVGAPGDPYALAAVTPSAARAARTPGLELIQRRVEACWKTGASAASVTATITLGSGGRLAAKPTVAGEARMVATRGREAINAITRCAPYEGAPAGRYEIALG